MSRIGIKLSSQALCNHCLFCSYFQSDWSDEGQYYFCDSIDGSDTEFYQGREPELNEVYLAKEKPCFEMREFIEIEGLTVPVE